MTDNSKSNSSNESIDFYDLLELLDAEVNRLCWSEKQYKAYVFDNYKTHSRLLLSDEQLFDLLTKLKSLTSRKIGIKSIKIGRKSNARFKNK